MNTPDYMTETVIETHGLSKSYKGEQALKALEGYEVDFWAQYPDSHQELIQVCGDLSDTATRQREIRALQEAAKEHPRATLHLVSLEPVIPADVPAGITVHSATAWLLRESEE